MDFFAEMVDCFNQQTRDATANLRGVGKEERLEMLEAANEAAKALARYRLRLRGKGGQPLDDDGEEPRPAPRTKPAIHQQPVTDIATEPGDIISELERLRLMTVSSDQEFQTRFGKQSRRALAAMNSTLIATVRDLKLFIQACNRASNHM